MEPFKTIKGIAVPLDRPNVDTDAIVPARYLKRIDRQGWGEVLFYDWRYKSDGEPDPSFVFNEPGYEGAKVLVAGRNFGTGSSREHAVWAIVQSGIRAVIASSFADIFHKNCFENGLVPVILPEDKIQQLMREAKEGTGAELTIDLEKCEVWDGRGFRSKFIVHSDPGTHEFRRQCLLDGRDEIALTMEHEDAISAFEEERPKFLDPAVV